MMNVCVLQHGSRVWLGSMMSWFEQRGYSINPVFLHRGDALPSLDQVDWLVVMGGGMSVYDEAEHPWLVQEKHFIRQALKANKKIVGICLGAQLIADVLGAKVYRNHQPEIGWHPIKKTHDIASWLPTEMRLLSWHDDCFDLPEGATAFANSDVTACQGFCIGNNVWALQFHMEAQPGAVKHFLGSAGGVLPEGKYVQTLEYMEQEKHFASCEPTMHALLELISHS